MAACSYSCHGPVTAVLSEGNLPLMAQVDMTMEANLTQSQAVHSFVKPRSVSDSQSSERNGLKSVCGSLGVDGTEKLFRS